MSKIELSPFTEKMRAEGLPEIAVQSFARAADFVAGGGATTVSESQIAPVDELEHLDALAGFEAAGRAAAEHAVVIKLNGGLGTSMGLSKAKSLLPVRGSLTFLDLIARQVLSQRKSWKSALPLVLMNSYRTQEDSLLALAAYPELAGDLPLDFLQHKVPRIDCSSFSPVDWNQDRSLEWCPPGHGDLYIAMKSSGMLDELLARGIQYAFVSNADNLGAVLDPRILGWMAEHELPFAMEVAERTESDRKGGHLARIAGRLMLREVAQCPREDLAAFQNVAKHRFFNTNNLWLDLQELDNQLSVSPAGLPLPIIANEKHVAPTDPASPKCLQLETAMGSAIECFEGASALVVPRERFAPVKTTNDLLTIWSDAYEMTEDARMVAVDPEAQRRRSIELDPHFFGNVEDLVARFPEGPPSLAKCRRMTVVGDHTFEGGVTIEGEAQLVNESESSVRVRAGSVVRGA